MCYIEKFPGEYGDHLLCEDKTPGCAECHPITGKTKGILNSL